MFITTTYLKIIFKKILIVNIIKFNKKVDKPRGLDQGDTIFSC